MCDCNESPFNKLRESWSRQCTGRMQGNCDCCCKPKVKGKFGVAYILETPNRKCKPCGWEIEFNDTPSQIENNCEKMMNWITCPPLGTCQNNQTNLCCCTTTPKECLAKMQQARCKAANQNLCDCCKEKYTTSGGDCCCKKPKKACCCQKEANQSQCRSQRKGKTNNCSCRGQQEYLKSRNKCAKCCCTLQSNEKQCCCFIQKNNDGCCCRNTKLKCTQSDSSSEECDCQSGGRRKTKNDCPCNNCKCFANTKTQTRSKKGDDGKGAANKIPAVQKQSKNLLSFEPKKEKQKSLPRSPLTISTNQIPKKEPDKRDFYEELTQRISQLGKDKMLEDKPTVENLKSGTVSEAEIKNQDDEKVIPKEILEVDEEPSDKPKEIQTKENYHLMGIFPVDEEPSDKPIQELKSPIERPRKKIKRSALLKKIKAKRKKENEAIHFAPKKKN